ncbi:phage holin [Longicatena caecimuris]|uniref:phage holin n=1 Tax=Longicatena caecimuris TaxID=1796635 RepID=UPI0018A955AD|nr:phage holin [Longicatena caecimuris]
MNLKVRLKNPVFWVQIGGAFLLTALGYNAMQPQDLTTWEGLFNVIKGVFFNPYLLALCLWNMWSAANDPTTKGMKDSNLAKSYDEPK